jgi:hypothetical protein
MLVDIKLPDVDDMLKLTEEIKELALQQGKLTIRIKAAEAQTVLKLRGDEKYFVGGKPLAMNAIDSMYKYTGIDGELVKLREKLSEIIAERKHKELIFEVYRDIIAIWRTKSANERLSTA